MQQKSQGSAFPHVLEWILLGLVFLYMVLFVFAWNSGQTITLRYWSNVAPHESKAAFPMMAAFIAGFVVATLVSSLMSLDRLIELRRNRNRLRALQEEVSRLRIGADQGGPAKPSSSA